MAVRRRRKGKSGKTTVSIVSLDSKMLEELELHMRIADRQETAQSRYLQRNQRARANTPSLSETVSAAVQDMRIEDG